MYDINYSSLEETVKKYILLIFFPIFKIIFIKKKEKKNNASKILFNIFDLFTGIHSLINCIINDE